MAKRVLQCAVRPGMTLAEIDTPALLVDMTALERNLGTMRKVMAGFPHMRLRPHAKTHKTPYLVDLQLQNGAAAVCCQKLDEAQAILAGSSVKDVMVTNEIVGKPKIARLMRLAKEAASKDKTLSVLVDDMSNLREVAEQCRLAAVRLGIWIEVNVGQNRCGIDHDSPVLLELARFIDEHPDLTFRGLQCYQGALQHVRAHADRQRLVDEVAAKARAARQTLLDARLPCPDVSGCGTGTFMLEGTCGVHTEVQAGSFMFMDADYGRNLAEGGGHVSQFEHALFVLTTVMSHTNPDRLVVDAGMKAVSLDSGPPTVVDETATQAAGRGVAFDESRVRYQNGGDEHGVLMLGDSGALPDAQVGTLLRLIPGHCDPTVNMFDFMVFVRDGIVERVEAIEGRGPGL